jgi:hypothetical protein
MTRRRWIFVSAAFVLLFAGVVVILFRKTAEPSFKGTSLTAWVEDIEPALIPGGRGVVALGPGMFIRKIPPGMAPVEKAKHDIAAAAIREMGTNAIPHLLKMIYARDSYLKTKAIQLNPKQKLITLPIKTSAQQRAHALPALEQLGPAALWAWINVLTNDSSTTEARTYASRRLQWMGRHAAPALLTWVKLLDHSNPEVMRTAQAALLNCDATGFLLSFHNLKNSPDRDVRASAAWSLGYIGKHPEKTIPALIAVLADTNRTVRQNAVEALGKFGTNAASATNYIRRAMEDPEPRVRSAATNALNQVFGTTVTN